MFHKLVIWYIIIFTQYCERKTVSPIDVIFALKQHGWNVYGFSRPYKYSVDKKKIPLCPKRGESFNSSYRGNFSIGLDNLSRVFV